MQRLLTVVHALGLLLIVFSSTYLLPVATSLIYHDEVLPDFLLAMGITLFGGLLIWLLTRRHKGELSVRHGFILVLGMWTAMPAFATLPLLLVIDHLSLTDAYFETMAGLTTAGTTTLSGLDALPPSINLWRHELQWLGGLGIIVLAVAVLPMLGVGGRQLFKAETPGPMKDTALAPRITETARNLWVVYVIFTLLCIGALRWAGMSWLDAVCHGFSTVGLGGFSTHDTSIAYFDSPMIEFIMIVFMLLASINFATHFLAWRGRTLSVYRLDREAYGGLILILGSCVFIALFLWWKQVYPDFLTALRHASFNLVTIATACGFASQDFGQWPIFAPLWMLFLSCISASSGSAGGGIKMIRTLVLIKQANREFVKLLHPQVVNPMKIGGRVVPNEVVYAVLGFIFLYIATITGLTFLLLLSGMDFISAFSAVIACFNNAGPGLGEVGPANNYASLTDFQTWVCTFAMLTGRLEIFTVVIVFTPAFWRR
jgi:trk system potassium uptake protein TrkH